MIISGAGEPCIPPGLGSGTAISRMFNPIVLSDEEDPVENLTSFSNQMKKCRNEPDANRTFFLSCTMT